MVLHNVFVGVLLSAGLVIWLTRHGDDAEWRATAAASALALVAHLVRVLVPAPLGGAGAGVALFFPSSGGQFLLLVVTVG